MSRYEFRLPDLGEGMVEAEIVEWHVKAGDRVAEDDAILDLMTDKATVEVPSPVDGVVVSTTGAPGDTVAVGSVLIVFETEGPMDVPAVGGADTAAAAPEPTPPPTAEPVPAPAAKPGRKRAAPATAASHAATPEGRPEPAPESGPVPAPAAVRRVAEAAEPAAAVPILTSPSIRRRARELGIDLAGLTGTGPDGRITQADFDAAVASGAAAVPRAAAQQPAAAAAAPGDDGAEEIKVIGVRRLIAERMTAAKRNIPHFAYVEEVDVTELESLRRHLASESGQRLTYLPFLALALVRVLPVFPQCNVHHDAERGVLRRFRAVHLGIATQTGDGLKVPVVRHAERRSLWGLAAEITRVSEAARDGTATRAELTGSTITVTSLGRLGGIVSTPIINAPEVAIIGVNRAAERPVVRDGTITVRLMMNLSSSFDHRFVDGHDAAAMIQAVKTRLEHPATLFMDEPGPSQA
jgi:2-oxoisovalerate dehydrogenase E2 component (dihydrolipoyl transacylase)